MSACRAWQPKCSLTAAEDKTGDNMPLEVYKIYERGGQLQETHNNADCSVIKGRLYTKHDRGARRRSGPAASMQQELAP